MTASEVVPGQVNVRGARQAEMEALRVLCEADPLFARRYEGWAALGSGENAAVVSARRRGSGVGVALKVYWCGAALGADDARGEAAALARVAHPCVVRVYGTFEDQAPLAWIEMEPVDGVTLADALRERAAVGTGAWPLAAALEIGACVAEGLAAVHAAGFAHRDLKPGNVLLPRNGRPAAKLADFGVARSLDATRRLHEERAGNPKYASPESARGEHVGCEGDVYALGLVLYELVSGGLFPFPAGQGTTAVEMLESHRRRAPVPLRGLGLGLPDELVDLIHRALDKRPERRPSAAELAVRLRALRVGEGEPSPGCTPGRRAAAVLALGLGVAMGLAMVLTLLWIFFA